MSSLVQSHEPSISPTLSSSQCSTLIDPPSSSVEVCAALSIWRCRTLLKTPMLIPLERYSIALQALDTSNKNLEYKIAKIHASTILLKLDLMKLQRHITCFHHDLLATWEADILTRLIEVVHERQGRNLPGGYAIGDHKMLDRGELSGVYTLAAGHIGKRTLKRMFGSF